MITNAWFALTILKTTWPWLSYHICVLTMIFFLNVWNVLFSTHFQDICANLYYCSYIQFGELIFILIILRSNESQHRLTVQLAVLPPGPSGFPCSSQFFLDSSFVKLRGNYSLHVKCLLTMITDLCQCFCSWIKKRWKTDWCLT